MGKSNQQCLLEEVEHAGVAQGEDSMIQERKSVLSSCEYPNKRLNRISTKIIGAFLLHFRKEKVISRVYQYGGSAVGVPPVVMVMDLFHPLAGVGMAYKVQVYVNLFVLGLLRLVVKFEMTLCNTGGENAHQYPAYPPD